MVPLCQLEILIPSFSEVCCKCCDIEIDQENVSKRRITELIYLPSINNSTIRGKKFVDALICTMV